MKACDAGVNALGARAGRPSLALKLPTTSVFYLEHGGQQEAPGDDSESRCRRLMVSRARSRGWQVLTLESDHLAQRTHVNELVALLEEIAQLSGASARDHK